MPQDDRPVMPKTTESDVMAASAMLRCSFPEAYEYVLQRAEDTVEKLAFDGALDEFPTGDVHKASLINTAMAAYVTAYSNTADALALQHTMPIHGGNDPDPVLMRLMRRPRMQDAPLHVLELLRHTCPTTRDELGDGEAALALRWCSAIGMAEGSLRAYDDMQKNLPRALARQDPRSAWLVARHDDMATQVAMATCHFVQEPLNRAVDVLGGDDVRGEAVRVARLVARAVLEPPTGVDAGMLDADVEDMAVTVRTFVGTALRLMPELLADKCGLANRPDVRVSLACSLVRPIPSKEAVRFASRIWHEELESAVAQGLTDEHEPCDRPSVIAWAFAYDFAISRVPCARNNWPGDDVWKRTISEPVCALFAAQAES